VHRAYGLWHAGLEPLDWPYYGSTAPVELEGALMAKVSAHLHDDGTWWLAGKATYYHRKAIKAVGGKWDGRRWSGPEKIIAAAKAEKWCYGLVEAHCHEPRRVIHLKLEDAQRGAHRMGCMLCDCRRANGGDVVVLGWWMTKKEAVAGMDEKWPEWREWDSFWSPLWFTGRADSGTT
jgi:hypothetical protein